jgi:peptide deformylase
MPILPIVKWPAKILETRALEVEAFDKSFQDFVKKMHETMDSENGIGLAANQVDVLKRVLTIFIPHTKDRYGEDREPLAWWHNKRFTFVNPVILQKKGKPVRFVEGCLSFPDIFDYVERPSQVAVRAYDEFGKEFTVDADGLFSICLQHEIDHLDGIVFTERMSRLKANAIRKKLLNAQKEKID